MQRISPDMEKDLFSFLPGGGKKAGKNSCASASAPGGCGAETEEELERMRNQMSAGRMRGGGQVNEMKKAAPSSPESSGERKPLFAGDCCLCSSVITYDEGSMAVIPPG